GRPQAPRAISPGGAGDEVVQRDAPRRDGTEDHARRRPRRPGDERGQVLGAKQRDALGCPAACQRGGGDDADRQRRAGSAAPRQLAFARSSMPSAYARAALPTSNSHAPSQDMSATTTRLRVRNRNSADSLSPLRCAPQDSSPSPSAESSESVVPLPVSVWSSVRLR